MMFDKIKTIKLYLLTAAILSGLSAPKSFAGTLSDDLFQREEIQSVVSERERAGWAVTGYEAIPLHSSWLGMGQNSKIVMLNVRIDGGSRYMQTNNVVAIFSAGSSGVFT